MRKIYLLSILILTLFFSSPSFSQDQTNKGKDFWIPYPEHINGTSSVMGIYITSDVNSTGVISVGATTLNFTVVANTITKYFVGPGGTFTNTGVYLGGFFDNVVSGRGIHITSTAPVVVFTHLIFSARSGATLVLPTKVWGKEYVVPSYANSGGSSTGQGYPVVDVFASQPNTVIEIKTTAATRNGAHAVGVPFQVTLPNIGDVYQLEFAQNTDPSGTVIKSIASGTGKCNPIAIFSATTWSAINCSSGNGGDNFLQQLFPTGTWGKSFVTGPLKKVATNPSDNNVDIIRVFVTDPSTLIKRTDNGITTILSGLNPKGYYEFTASRPNLIEADKPIQVMQYITTQSCGNPVTQSDPEMIAISAVEQTINDITVFSADRVYVPNNNSNVTTHYINVVMKTANTPLFKINGVPPNGTFTPIPGTSFSYLKENVTAQVSINPVFRLTADSGFNAIAYGFGDVESYGYNAGTNVKDLYQQIGVSSEYGIETTPSVCKGSPFKFKVSLPYVPDSIYWDFHGASGMTPNNNNVMVSNVIEDSTTVVNGKTIHWYSLPTSYVFNITGTFPITITTYVPNGDCGATQDIDFDLVVSDPPTAGFTFNTTGCVTQPVNFQDNSNTVKPTYHWWWSFGDPGSGANNTSNLKNPSHTFSAPGTYTVRYSNITTPGCLSDTVEHQVTVSDVPTANFSVSTPLCINQPVNFQDHSAISAGGGSLGKWTWTFGDASPPVVVIAPNPPNQVHTYTAANTYNATLKVESSTGCPSIIFTLPVIILPDATITLTSATGTNNQTVCVNVPITPITYNIGGSGTGASVTALPAGLTGVFSGGVFTISGTVSTPGTYPYTVSTNGPCAKPQASGTITITPDATITLTSATGTNDQTVCVNSAITSITYMVGGSGNNVTVTGLPPGVTWSFAGGVLTITGAPTTANTYNYSITATGPCGSAPASGRIVVSPTATITLTSAPGTDNQTVCINTAITPVTFAIGGSGTGGSVTGLPPAFTWNYAGGVVTISGTASVAPGNYPYTVVSSGPCQPPTQVSGMIIVSPNATVTLTSPSGTDNQTVCVSTPIIPIAYTVGGSATNGTLTGPLPPGVTWSFAGGVLSISGTPTVNGVYPYTVNITGTCQPTSASGTITVTSNASISLSSAPGTDNQIICVNTPIIPISYTVGGSATNAAATGLPAGVTGSLAGGIFTISGTPTTTMGSPFLYTVSVTGPCGPSSASGIITVTGDATITLTSPPSTTTQELCFNQPITAITYSIGGTGNNAVVTGLPAGITGIYSGGVVTISGTSALPGTFNYTVRGTGPCQDAIATGTITINALPTSNFTYTAPTCETRLISFTDASVPNSGNIGTWSWNFGDPSSGPNNTSGLPNPTHTFASAGTYNVTLVVTTDKGCTSLQPAKQVIVNLRPLAGFVVPEVCLNDTQAQFQDTSKVSAPDNIAAWDWNFGDPSSGANNISNFQNPGHSYSATGPYNVRLVATTNKGCTDTITQVLFVNGSFPQADFTVNSPATLCANDTVSIVEASTVFPGTITKVEIYWDNVGQPGVFVTDNSPVPGKVYKHLYPNFQNPLTKTFTIRYRAYSGGVCVNDKFRTITVNAAPKVQFTTVPPLCLNAPPHQLVEASETGGVPGTPLFTGPGVSPGGLFSPLTVGPGTYRILYTFTSSAGGCVDTISNLVTVLEAPTADFSIDPPNCETKLITFRDNSNAPVGTLTTWTWDFGDASPLVIRNSNAPVTHTYAATGVYQVKLTVTTSDGCNSTVKTIPVTVNPQPKPNFSTPASACLPNASVSFGDLSTIADGSQASFTYLWNFGDPGSGSNNTSTLANPTHIYSGTGPFSITLQVTSNNGCVDTKTLPLNTIHPEPVGSFTVDKTDVCIGGSFSFNNTSDPADGTTTSYNWVMDDGNIKITPSFVYTYSNPGTYNVKLFIFNSHGCRSSTAEHTVFVNPFPATNAGPDLFMLEGGQVTLTPTLITNMQVTYLWSPTDYLNDPTKANAIASPPEDKIYTLTVTSDKGCSKSDDVFIKVLKAPAVPNIFSPNGDGVHDKWVIQYLDSYPDCTVDIFNRYGQLIFHSVGYGTPWDGTVHGTPVPIGTYYYIVNPKNGRKQMTGYVDVIR